MLARSAPILALVSLLAAATPAAAQTAILDEGTFRLSVRGTPVGTETFTIRQTGSGASASTVAQGRIALDSGEQTRALLQVEGPGLRPAAYQIEATGIDRRTIRGQTAGNRFRAQIVSATGETMREYLISEGAIILDDAVAHHHYFVAARAATTAPVPIIVPGQNRQVTGTITEAGSETIDVAGQRVSARRVLFEPSGLAARTIWVDNQGRVLRLAIPDHGFVAERTALPDS